MDSTTLRAGDLSGKHTILGVSAKEAGKGWGQRTVWEGLRVGIGGGVSAGILFAQNSTIKTFLNCSFVIKEAFQSVVTLRNLVKIPLLSIVS